ncbi:MAG: hypothetical protein B7X31_10720 [Thiomonas sp. 13-66-29]|jgi:amino acid adenylation domain-containing protein|nr:MAG: hypothetical protein B7X31_10720 [Thiomonas sp. 13-66-29]
MSQQPRNLAAHFQRSADAHPQSNAICVASSVVTYSELATRARQLARKLHDKVGVGARVAIFADKSLSSYVAVLATLYARCTYVPLSPIYPAARSRAILEAARATVFVYQCSSSAVLQELCVALPPQTSPIELDDLVDQAWQPSEALQWQPPALIRTIDAPVEPAYILFTSGSTGKPKGVPISHGNVLHYLSVINRTFDFTPQDRFTQNFELTFDLSVFDLFVPWYHGAACYVPSMPDVAAPAQYLKRHSITVWFSVPSAVRILQRNGRLEPVSFPSLRLSLFCGEALTWDAAEAWAQAAPNSVIFNLYGPTELTVSCFIYRVPSTATSIEYARPLVPIGRIHDNHKYLVVDECGQPVALGQEGELCISGEQQFRGYLDDPSKSEAAHLLKADADGSLRVYYRTGDLVLEDEDRLVHYLGRLDHQVKVNGYRVELEEIERAIRRLPGSLDAVVRFARDPEDAAGQKKLVAFVTGQPQDDREVLRQLHQTLPHYMLPDRIVWAGETFPLNGNGKVDVKTLLGTVS